MKSFRFSVPDTVAYEAGQFFFVTIKISGKEAVHHFSISSSPTEKGFIEFTKKITTHEFSQALKNIKPGDWAHIFGPMGTFTLVPGPEKVAFLTGGIGITPLRSMLRYIADTKQNRDITLLYGNSSYKEIVFRDELENFMDLISGLKIEHVLSGPVFPPGWKGREGHINKTIISESIPDYKERIFYLSGPPKMVLNLEDQLLALGLSRELIRQDSFTGYD